MKTAKKILAILMAVAMVAAFGVTAYAAGENLTITVDNATVGKDYTAYKLFDAAVDANGNVTYSVPVGTSFTADGIDGTQWFNVNDSTGAVTPKTDFNEDDLKGADFQKWAKAFGQSMGTQTAGTTKVEFMRLDAGYYFVTSSLGSLVTVTTATGNASIKDKNQKPDWPPVDGGKKVNNASVNTAELDKSLDFTITIDATNYDGEEKVFKYEITDTVDPGMTYLSVPTITVDGANPAASTYSVKFYDATNAEVTDRTKATSFKIVINWTDDGTAAGNSTSAGNSIYANPAKLVVSYQAKLDSAKVSNINDVDPNKNVASFKYWSAVPGGVDPVDPKGESAESKSESYLTSITISKVDLDNSNKPLAGAEFTLTGNGSSVTVVSGTRFNLDNTNGTYWKLKDGTYTTTDPNTTGVNQDAYELPLTNKYVKETYTEVVGGTGTTATAMKGTVAADTGELTFTGLVPGTYKLEETGVPAGYSKAKNVEFTLSFNAGTKKWSVTPSTSGVNVTDGANGGGSLDVTIGNSKSIVMPSTGGIGTTIFYVLGSVLLLGAAVLLITRKRMKNEA